MSVDTFSALSDLAAIDRHIAQLRYNREHLGPSLELRDVHATLHGLVGELREVEQHRSPLVAQRDELESQTAALRQRMDELARRLASSTAGPRDLEAMTTEVAHLRDNIDLLETKEIEVLEALEPYEIRFAEIGRAAKIATERRDELDAMVAAGQQHIDDEIARALQPRAEVASRLSSGLAERYERILARVHDVAAVDVVDGKCTGCKIAVVALDLARWKAAPADDPASCPECSRLWIGPS